MKRVKIGSWLLDIDVEKTATYYRQTKMMLVHVRTVNIMLHNARNFLTNGLLFFIHLALIRERKEKSLS